MAYGMGRRIGGKLVNASKWARSAVFAGTLFVAAASQAAVVDASILLEKAANNRSITVKYDGAPAASLELLVNKVSLLTRNLPGTEARGEVQLPLDTALIPDGDSEIEVRLLDKGGNLLGTQVTKVQIDRTGKGPVFFLSPGVGDTVKGYIDIKVGFRAELRNAYVSFFVNDEFKALKNYPPYTYSFDTTKVTNGWHEIQAYAVDDTNETFRTEKLRVYVSNPGGLTARQPVIPALGPVAAPVTKPAAKPVGQTPFAKPVTAPIAPANPLAGNGDVVEQPAVKAVKTAGTLPAAPKATRPVAVTPVEEPTPVKPVVTKPVAPVEVKSVQVTPVAKPAPAPVEVKPVQVAPVTKPAPVPVEVKPVAKPVNTTEVKAATAAPADALATFKPAPIVRGTRLSGVRTFGIVMDGTKMVFDVPGRVSKGVPTAPVRYLFERKGIEVKWNQKDKVVTGTGNGDFWLQIGNPVAKVNGRDLTMESSPYLWHSRTFVPLSFIGEALDVEAVFDPATNHVMILSRKTVADASKKA